jgi:hypothetical protein
MGVTLERRGGDRSVLSWRRSSVVLSFLFADDEGFSGEESRLYDAISRLHATDENDKTTEIGSVLHLFKGDATSSNR